MSQTTRVTYADVYVIYTVGTGHSSTSSSQPITPRHRLSIDDEMILGWMDVPATLIMSSHPLLQISTASPAANNWEILTIDLCYLLWLLHGRRLHVKAELTYLPLRLDDKRRAGRQRLKHKSEQSILNMCYRRLKKLGSQYPQVFDGFCAQNPQVAVRVRQCVVTHARAAQPTAAKTVTVVSTLGAGVDDRDAATTDRRAAAADRRAAAADLEAARADRESAAAYRAAASADRAKAANHRSTMVLDAAIRPRAFHNTDGVGAGARGALALALAVARPFAFGPHTHVPRTEDNNGSEDPSGASDGLCVICQDHKANVVLIDCKHMVMCKDCCGLILRGNASRRKCPICRAPIRSPSRKLTVFSS